jgi:hypothetical protein
MATPKGKIAKLQQKKKHIYKKLRKLLYYIQDKYISEYSFKQMCDSKKRIKNLVKPWKNAEVLSRWL